MVKDLLSWPNHWVMELDFSILGKYPNVFIGDPLWERRNDEQLRKAVPDCTDEAAWLARISILAGGENSQIW